jgi:hypothetical protein
MIDWEPEPRREDLNARQLVEELASRRVSHPGILAWYTRAINDATRLAALCLRTPPSEVNLRLMIERQANLARRMNNVIESLNIQRYYDDQGADNIEAYDALIDAQTARSQQVETDVLTQIARYETALRVAAPAQGNPGQGPPKIATDLKPKTPLSREATPVELKIWFKRFTAYYEASQMHRLPILVQHEYFRASLDDYLVERLADRMTPIIPIQAPQGDNSCYALLEEEFFVFHPIYTRRLDFFKSTAAPGESASQWAAQLKRMGDEASIGTLGPDEIFCMRYLVGLTHNTELLNELLKDEDPTRDRFDMIIQRYEQGMVYKSGNAVANAAFVPRQSKEKKHMKTSSKPDKTSVKAKTPKQQQQQQPKTAIRLKLDEYKAKNICMRCGKKGQHECDYNSLRCQTCSRPGHISSVCLQHLRPANANSTQTRQYPPGPSSHYESARGSIHGDAEQDQAQAYSLEYGQQN